MAEFFQVLVLVAVPATILFTVRCLIIRQNRMVAREPVRSRIPVRRS